MPRTDVPCTINVIDTTRKDHEQSIKHISDETRTRPERTRRNRRREETGNEACIQHPTHLRAHEERPHTSYPSGINSWTLLTLPRANRGHILYYVQTLALVRSETGEHCTNSGQTLGYFSYSNFSPAAPAVYQYSMADHTFSQSTHLSMQSPRSGGQWKMSHDNTTNTAGRPEGHTST